ncbi:methoxyneurosporene dehydrogenase [Erythrobacter sp. NAP1]|uniref:1-hydroxycarotenoid 3,4-desaturase CrtD n=1 Tax=Erythrobacter sp. NAP1 TaxID=237727 RepID=UPI00006851A0|nr:1-hydroxycarotenoid 3,4-desaturase CrtD [Erythrobacter sp. NAP1]EAQ27777.1 methoxyneurosporene dehydrogenase [Erythrobacter sp. NAP1]
MGGRVVVIGAGMGGLASAARLSARGYDVTVVEKEEGVGGKARRVTVDGHPVDAGPTVFTMRDVFDEIFAECGMRLNDRVRIRRAEIIARHAWDDSETLDLFADPLRSEEAVGDFAGAEAARLYREFRHTTRRMHDILDKPMMRGDNVSSPLPLLWRIGLWRFSDFAAMRPHQSMWNALGEFFPDPRLRQLFGRYATYCGSSPFDAPATLMLIAHVEATGVWLIDGGIHALAEALKDAAEAKGAQFRLGTSVAQILTERGSGAKGVRLENGDVIEADAVICNADPNAIAQGCFGKSSERAVKALAPEKRSLSAMVWFAHAGTSGFDLTHHNVFFSRDYRREFDEIASGQVPSEPSVYVCAQDRGGHAATASSIAQGKRERIQIIVNAPANGDTHPYPDEEKERCTTQMRATLERCGLELEQDMPQELASPAEWERLFPATGGALYGRASHGSAASFLRQGPRTRMPGLYCAGGATHPSAGVPMAALSGLLAAKKVDADLASTRRSSRVAIHGGTSMPSARRGVTG